MTKDRITVCVAIDSVPSGDKTVRYAKADQRVVVQSCRNELAQKAPGYRKANTSVTHSRGWVAVAALCEDGAGPDVPKIGVDIEYADPDRNWAGIIDTLARGRNLRPSPDKAALIWTCHEAAFKANGAFLPGAQIEDISRALMLSQINHWHVSRFGALSLFSAPLSVDRRFALTVALAGAGMGVDVEIQCFFGPFAAGEGAATAARVVRNSIQ